jgi:outer membrane protein TolC
VTVVRDAFLPKLYGGSGAAWTSGYPSSIDGNAPAIFMVKTKMALFDRPQSYQVAQANEAVRTAEIDVGARQEEVAFRVAGLFLDADRASRGLGQAERQAESLTRVRELVEVRVAEGRELPIASKIANLAVLRARQRVEAMTADLINAETSLALVLGMGPDDRVRASPEERATLDMPSSEERSIETALDNSRELKRLESNLQSKTLEVKEHKSERLPKINLVAQYSLLAKDTYQAFFGNSFQRNNGQLGASIEVPLLMGRAASAYVSQAEVDAAKLRVEVGRTRSRITADLRRAYQDVRRADSARDVARADLDLARDQLTLDLAQMDEGRLPLAKVEESRATENEKWLAYYEAQHTVEQARLNVLRQTGTLLAALK